MAHRVTRTTLDGMEALLLASGDSEVEATFVPGAGMVCCSLRHRGDELLGQRSGLRGWVERRSTMGIPLLHPWANRLGGLSYSAAGRDVTIDPGRSPVKLDANGLPIHGLLGPAGDWEVAGHAEAEGAAEVAARFDFSAHPDLLAAFPFPHVLEVEARLTGAELSIRTSLTAEDAPVPVAFGWHPYLQLPGAPREEWELGLPVASRAELDERGIPTGARAELGFTSGALGDLALDDLYPTLSAPAVFSLRGGGRTIEVEFGRGYPVAQVYAPLDLDAVCFEPMTAPTNALAGAPGAVPIAQPGEPFSATFSVRVAERP